MNDQMENHFDTYSEWNRIDVREALELLSDRLEPNQVVLILLIDVFDFTAKETGKLFGKTEGAIKAALNRARMRLNIAAVRHPECWGDSVLTTPRQGLSIDVFEAFVNGFRRLDPLAIFQSYQTMVSDGVKLVRIERSRNMLSFTIADPDGNLLTIIGHLPPAID